MANWTEVKALDYAAAGNDLTTKTYHGVSILVNGNAIGRIASYTAPTQDRTITPVRELSPAGQPGGAFGRVIEQVPGIVGDGSYTIAVSRTEVWSNEMEIAFGYEARFTDLCDQTRPFTLEEKLFKGNAHYQTFTYLGCWFSKQGINAFESNGDAIIKIDAEITFTSRRLI